MSTRAAKRKGDETSVGISDTATAGNGVPTTTCTTTTADADATLSPAAAKKPKVAAASSGTVVTVKSFPPHLNPTDPSHFDHFLFQLLLFKSANNNFNVSKEEYPQLHAWLLYLKREFKVRVGGEAVSQLTHEQVQVLEYLHIPLTSRGDDHWNRFYQLLQEYKNKHGHSLVPRLCEIPGLGDWVTDQRRQYKAQKQGHASQLSEARQAKLEALGFTWQVRDRPEWDIRFGELMEYKAEHGDCKVPQHYKPNKALGKWVAKQREQYKLLKIGKHSFLTPYRLEQLESVGFSWQIRTGLDFDLRDVLDAPPAGVETDGDPDPSAATVPFADPGGDVTKVKEGGDVTKVKAASVGGGGSGGELERDDATATPVDESAKTVEAAMVAEIHQVVANDDVDKEEIIPSEIKEEV